MRLAQAKEIANAILYEGYLLYPYRHSALKNRERWTFGVVYPREYSELNGGIEPWAMQTECLFIGQADTTFDIMVRFLHLQSRTIIPSDDIQPDAKTLAHESCEEGIEREINLDKLTVQELLASPRVVELGFPGERCTSSPTAPTSLRERRPILGAVIVSAEKVGAPCSNIFKLSVRIENWTPHTNLTAERFNATLLQAFISTHTLMQIQQGRFISQIDPPDELKSLAQSCKNLRTWPVLLGDEGEASTMLSAPIILYDYPQIAPESPGPLFDGTEIDELLSLRILTLTDEEKQEMRRADAHTREILERTEALTPEQFMKLHGTIRGLRPVSKGGEI
ncbi:hypothetical protein EPA93_43885 [Ktedonosporobacter rubrisoli]|uniref:Uncharacterized protein n=1 Tax=Ktedonosporobacter rubrisoli TaxID=2509675 RepID=A0A4P6K2U1_KTERU|nr:hypothetical protein [Ktedonosporobacter rubrisoli]QBD82547.1 hypothetical protein EPA93_43885 [Ktedonosporobacter rubrisoli]